MELPRDPLVLVADPLSGGREWERLRPLLDPAFRVTEVPWADSGDGPAAEEPHAALARVLDEPDFYPAHVLASSFAAAPVLRLAARRPDLFRSLLLHEPLVLLGRPTGPDAEEELRRRLTPVAEALDRREFGRASERLKAALGEDPVGPTPGLSGFEPDLKERGGAWARQLASPTAWSIPPSLSEFLAPALVLDGELTPGFVRRIGTDVAGRFPNVLHLRLPGAGHFLPYRDPPRLAGVLMTFCLERQVPSA